MMKRIVSLFFLFITCLAFSQSQVKIDSLRSLLSKKITPDTNLATLYNDLAYAYSRANTDSSKVFADKAFTVSKKINYQYGIASAYVSYGIYYHLKGEYDKALSYYALAQKIKTHLGDKKGAASAQNNAGIVHYMQGNYKKALELYENSIVILKAIKDTVTIANTYNYIASVYYYRADYNKALKYYLASLELCEKKRNYSGIAQARNNIGIIYNVTHKQDKAIENYEESLKASKISGDRITIASCYNNLGSVYKAKGELNKAYNYFHESLKLARELKLNQGIAYNLINIGSIHDVKKEYKEALEFYKEGYKVHEKMGERHGMAIALTSMAEVSMKFGQIELAQTSLDKALKLATDIQADEAISSCYKSFSNLYKIKKEYKKSIAFFKKYRSLEDSIVSHEKNKNMAEMQTRYDTDKKEKEIVLLTKSKNIEELQVIQQKANIKKQRIIIYASIVGLTLALVLVFFVMRSFNERKKANLLLNERNVAISEQKHILEGKSKFITDSIVYAKSMQETILPSQEEVKRLFPNSFILFRPKDVVSGDFFWVKEFGNDLYLAAVDCVGHGVPGAFMAVHSYNLLERIIKEKNVPHCGVILDHLQTNVLETLRQDDEDASAKHGMDLSMIKIAKETTENKNGVKIEYAGAHNSLIIVGKELQEIKADRMYVGGAKKNFTHHYLNVEKGSMVYLFTDGYADQKGGKIGKKFYSQSLRDILTEVAHLTIDKQKNALENAHLEWKKQHEQIDDILIIGVRV